MNHAHEKNLNTVFCQQANHMSGILRKSGAMMWQYGTAPARLMQNEFDKLPQWARVGAALATGAALGHKAVQLVKAKIAAPMVSMEFIRRGMAEAKTPEDIFWGVIEPVCLRQSLNKKLSNDKIAEIAQFFKTERNFAALPAWAQASALNALMKLAFANTPKPGETIIMPTGLKLVAWNPSMDFKAPKSRSPKTNPKKSSRPRKSASKST